MLKTNILMIFIGYMKDLTLNSHENMKKKILFIDRDGTILCEPDRYFQIDSLEKFRFVPGVIGALARIVRQTDYRLVMVSNQDGLGTPAFPMDDFLPLQQLMLRTLEGEGIVFDEVLIDDSFPEWNSPGRKPRTGMVDKYLNDTLDREASLVIGDRETDMQLAANMGLGAILIGTAEVEPRPVLATASWDEVARFLCGRHRTAEYSRKTSETDITARVDLDGTGQADIATGIGFFDHMLCQVARHGSVDLRLRAVGDLGVDQHHTIEDTALVLGECVRRALGSGKGIARYAFALPMDESCAEVLMDMGGRSTLVWEAEFPREYAGDFPTDMARHFFDSFCRAAGCTMHVRAAGDNTHHMLESIFKAWGRCMRTALRCDGSGEVPSTKGVV